MALPTYESRGLKIINEQAASLPTCPVCGDITNLDEIIIRAAAPLRGAWRGYVLRCINSTDPHGLRRQKNPDKPLCTFAVPMTYEAPGLT